MERLDDTTLKKLQLAELNVLIEMVRICDKHKLTYYLTGGTLLGAVKYKGFIPWDDDVDVSMPVDDYRKFVEIANSELPRNMFMETVDTDDTHIEPYGKLKILNSTFIQEGYNPYGKNNGIWIDIFPILYANSKKDCDRKCFKLKLSYCCNSKEYVKENLALLKESYGGLNVMLLKIFIKTPKSFRKWVYNQLTDPVFNEKDGAYVFEAYPWMNTAISCDILEGEKNMIEFEGHKFSVIPKPEKYLTAFYGDYMRSLPEDQRFAHKPQIIDFEHSYKEIIINKNK